MKVNFEDHEVEEVMTMTDEVTSEVKEEKTLTVEDMNEVVVRNKQLFEILEMTREDRVSYSACLNEIIENNMRLVSHVLKKYRPFGEDEFQTGCVGLIKAAQTFDPNRGVPFASYACFCIERELHMVHRKVRETFEYQCGSNLSSLDELMSIDFGDEISKHETIADSLSEDMFNQIMLDFDLNSIFTEIILPAIDEIAGKTRGQDTAVDFEVWRRLELRYLLELAEVDSQKSRVTLSAIAKELGVSIQNIRMRHLRVVEIIRLRCVELGLHD